MCLLRGTDWMIWILFVLMFVFKFLIHYCKQKQMKEHVVDLGAVRSGYKIVVRNYMEVP